MDARRSWSDGPKRTAAPKGALSSRALADRITEDGLQLLYAARQDIAEHTSSAPASPLLDGAQLTVLDAIGVLRDVAASLNSRPAGHVAELMAGHDHRRREFERSRQTFLENQRRWQERRRRRQAD